MFQRPGDHFSRSPVPDSSISVLACGGDLGFVRAECGAPDMSGMLQSHADLPPCASIPNPGQSVRTTRNDVTATGAERD